jgi:RNA polymerase primary sigma factor
MFLYYHRQQQKMKMEKERLDEFLEEIGRTPLLSADEEAALCKAVLEKGTDCDEMRQLEKANMRFVVIIANQYQHRGLTLGELIEAGTNNLRKGAMKCDASHGIMFIAYAVKWIRQSILQAIESIRQ